MPDILDTLTINNSTRAIVAYDFYSSYDCPLTWGDVQAHTLHASSSLATMADFQVRDDDASGIEDVRDGLGYGDHCTEADEREAILKHLRRKGYVATIAEVGGRDGVHVAVFYAEPDGGDTESYLRGEIETFRQWANGEVYIVAIQARETWTNSHGDTRETWETIDSVGGYYLNRPGALSEAVCEMGYDVQDLK